MRTHQASTRAMTSGEVARRVAASASAAVAEALSKAIYFFISGNRVSAVIRIWSA